MNWTPLVVGLGLGAGLAYVLDPNQGRRRRAYLRDQSVQAANRLGRSLPVTATDLKNRAQGLAAEARARLRRESVPDEVLVERVRSAMGRAVSHPHAIEVMAENGRVTLQGPVLENEENALVAVVASVRGVENVDNRLERHRGPGNLPELQPGSTRPGRYGLARENWPPAARLLAGITGGSLIAYGVSRRGGLGTSLGMLGLGLLARGATNLPLDRLTGVGAGRLAIRFQKTLNIAAPAEEVFAFCSFWENFPRFMTHVREVTGEGRQSHWTVDGPAGIPVSWDAVVTQFIPNELLAWKSVEGSAVHHAGIMRFEENPDGTTRLDIKMSYNPPAGAVGHVVANLFGVDPKRQMDEDFNRLKSLIEEGKTSTPECGEITRDQLAA